MEFVAGAIQAAVCSGIERQRIYKVAGLTVEDLADRNKQIPVRQFVELLESAAILAQDDCFGLHFGLNYHLFDLGVLGYILLNSASVGSALETLIHYFDVCQQSTEVTLTLDGGTVLLSYQISDASIQTRRQDAEAAMAFALTMIRTLTRCQHWHPQAVLLEHEPPTNTSEHQRILEAPLLFGQPFNALIVERSLLKQKIPLADQSLLPVLEHHLQTLLAQRESNSELVAAVSQIIIRSLAQGCPRLGEIASGLGVSDRTLRRYLRERNVTFKQLVDETRLQLSLNYLKDPNISLIEVALLLGYSQPSAFSHAFRRWTGFTPCEYRQQLN